MILPRKAALQAALPLKITSPPADPQSAAPVSIRVTLLTIAAYSGASVANEVNGITLRINNGG
jgi:hypothetical protein